MSSKLTEWDWTQLIKKIEEGNCTPFLGAGINSGMLPLGADIARAWASAHKFPMKDSHDLARVAQFLALTTKVPIYPKELIRDMFKERIEELFDGDNPPSLIPPNPLGVLAALPLRTYITTNYDDFMFRALRLRGKKPKVELCAWATFLKKKASVIYAEPDEETLNPPIKVIGFERSRFQSSSRLKPTANDLSSAKYKPSQAAPLIYHLHGHYSLVDSLVLTENDYLDFLVRMWRDPKLLPEGITYALTGSSLLFMGYSLADPNFRVLFRGLIHPFAENRRLSVSIQLRPSDVAQPDEERALDFLEKYFEDLKIKVFWGTAEEFAAELWQRWTNRPSGGGNNDN